MMVKGQTSLLTPDSGRIGADRGRRASLAVLSARGPAAREVAPEHRGSRERRWL